jgi:hypothetical protein
VPHDISWVTELSHASAAVLVIAVVSMFLRYLATRDRAIGSAMRDVNKTLRTQNKKLDAHTLELQRQTLVMQSIDRHSSRDLPRLPQARIERDMSWTPDERREVEAHFVPEEEVKK